MQFALGTIFPTAALSGLETAGLCSPTLSTLAGRESRVFQALPGDVSD